MPFDKDELEKKLNDGKLGIVFDSSMGEVNWKFSNEGKLQYNIDEFINNGKEIDITKADTRNLQYLGYFNGGFLYDFDKSRTLDNNAIYDIDTDTLPIKDTDRAVIAYVAKKGSPMSKIGLLSVKQQLKEQGQEISILTSNFNTNELVEYNPTINEVSSLLNFAKNRYYKGRYAQKEHVNIPGSIILDNKSDQELLENFKGFAKSLGYPIDSYNDINQDVSISNLDPKYKNPQIPVIDQAILVPDQTTHAKLGHKQYTLAPEKLKDYFAEGTLLARTRAYSAQGSNYADGLIQTTELDKELGFLNNGEARAQSTTLLTQTKFLTLFGMEVGLLYNTDQSTIREMYIRDASTSIDRKNFGKVQSAVNFAPAILARTTVSHKEFLQKYKDSFQEGDVPRYNEVIANLFEQGLVGTIIDNDSKEARLELLAVNAYASEKQGKDLVPTILNKGQLEIYEPSPSEIINLLNYAYDVYELPLQKTAQSIGYIIKENVNLNNPLTPNDIQPIERRAKIPVLEQNIIKSHLTTEVLTNIPESIDHLTHKQNMITKDNNINGAVQNSDKIGEYKLVIKHADSKNNQSPTKSWVPLTEEEIKAGEKIKEITIEKAKKVWEEHSKKGGNTKIPPAPVIREDLAYKPKHKRSTSTQQNKR